MNFFKSCGYSSHVWTENPGEPGKSLVGIVKRRSARPAAVMEAFAKTLALFSNLSAFCVSHKLICRVTLTDTTAVPHFIGFCTRVPVSETLLSVHENPQRIHPPCFCLPSLPEVDFAVLRGQSFYDTVGVDGHFFFVVTRGKETFVSEIPVFVWTRPHTLALVHSATHLFLLTHTHTHVYTLRYIIRPMTSSSGVTQM